MMGNFKYVEPLFRPPSEANSLILQATVGCSQNQCAFCGMYKSKTFRARPVAELVAEIQSVPPGQRGYVQRVFIADGDALVYPQQGLETILEALSDTFPRLTRVGAYASPKSLTTKTVAGLAALQRKKLRILYFGLESGDADTLKLVNKGYHPSEMLQLCRNAQAANIKLSITAILGIAGRGRTAEHAAATADWITELSPEYFSLLTMFRRHNDDYFRTISPLSHGEIMEETLALLRRLNPQRTILRSNHVSNFLNLAGSYPKDRERLIETAERAMTEARRHPVWFSEIPDYQEEYY